jgi:chromosome segregation ATPase
MDRASALEEVVSGDVSEVSKITPREVQAQSNELDNIGGQHVDAMALAQGGEALLRRLAHHNNAYADLRRQLESQVKEVSTLTEAGYSQQQLLREFERQADHNRQNNAAAVEARVRAEVAENEVRLEALLDEAKEKAAKVESEFLERQRELDGQRRHVEGERDDARERLREVEARLETAVNAPEAQDTRAKALEMELNLLRSRFARETEAKKAAERASAESKAQQQELKACLEREVAQVRKLRKALDEQTELAAFRQEVVNDLQSRLKDQKSEADNKLRREKGKLEAVNRLEGILPKHMLLQALA